MRRAWVLTVVLAGCLQESTVMCADGRLCPAGYNCSPFGCVAPEQLAACSALADGDPCTAGFGDGACLMEVCLPVDCGDGRVVGEEVCDDGNQRANDGCSGDCLSNETCGNNYVDGVLGEQCDDDVYGQSRDGCTSKCTQELPAWSDQTPRPPSARFRTAMTFDERRGRAVLFGGYANLVPLGDTWEMQDKVWFQREVAAAPSPRLDAALAYDGASGLVVLFGGSVGGTYFGDTWVWDGIEWQKKSPVVSPSPRAEAVMAYDRAREQLVLYGGTGNGVTTSTWTWDGTTWLEHPGAGPPVANLEMAWDGTTQRLVAVAWASAQTWAWNGSAWSVVSGAGTPSLSYISLAEAAGGAILMFGGGNKTDAAHRFDGATWSSVTAGPRPPGRVQHAMTFDTLSGETIVFGGSGTSGDLQDTAWWKPVSNWELEGDAYRIPRAVSGAGGAYLPSMGRGVLFGGEPWDETWLWDGQYWEKDVRPTRPAIFRYDMGFAASRDRVLLFGGWTLINGLYRPVDETWEYRATGWEQKQPATKPSERYGASLAYDRVRDRFVLFGGHRHTVNERLDDTWIWDGTNWSPLTVSTPPPARRYAAMTYDVTRDRVVLVGGEGTAGNLGDVWELDGTSWVEVVTPSSPTPRREATLVWDPRRKRSVLFGGMDAMNTSLGDVWEWDGTTWTERVTDDIPPPRNGHIAFYDEANVNMVIYGGASNGQAVDDTWTYQLTSRAFPGDRCVDVDTDADGLVGCADPDCAGRCGACGNGTCDAVEDFRLCAADCPSP